MKKVNFEILILGFILITSFIHCDKKDPLLYFIGQTPPKMEAKRFAKDMLFTKITDSIHEELHSSVHFSADSKMLFYTLQTRAMDTGKYTQNLMIIQFENGQWNKPKPAPFASKFSESFVSFSPDGKGIYFNSGRPVDETAVSKGGKIWYVEKKNKQWGKPKFVGSLLADGSKLSNPCFSKKNNVYFKQNFAKKDGGAEIVKSTFNQNKFSNPVKLSSSINTENYENFPLITPNEKFLIFYRMIRGGESGQFISWKDENGQWSKAVNMGKKINGGGTAFCCSFSPDKKYIFYLLRNQKKNEGREEGIYWISTDILKTYKNN